LFLLFTGKDNAGLSQTTAQARIFIAYQSPVIQRNGKLIALERNIPIGKRYPH